MSSRQSRIAFTSVTFRSKTAEENIRIACDNLVSAIEWGGDIHAPAGDAECGNRIRRMSIQSGIDAISYGSYFQLREKMDINPWLITGKALGASNIRIWAGDVRKKQIEADPVEIRAAAEELRQVCRAAADYGMVVSLEKHRNTLTQNPDTALRLIEAAAMPNLKIYWQPNPEVSILENESAIRKLLPYISNVHVFSWTKENERLALSDGETAWKHYMDLLENRCYILEFVRNDSEIQFRKDVETLRTWLGI